MVETEWFSRTHSENKVKYLANKSYVISKQQNKLKQQGYLRNDAKQTIINKNQRYIN